jgi:hypothetical protein
LSATSSAASREPENAFLWSNSAWWKSYKTYFLRHWWWGLISLGFVLGNLFQSGLRIWEQGQNQPNWSVFQILPSWVSFWCYQQMYTDCRGADSSPYSQAIDQRKKVAADKPSNLFRPSVRDEERKKSFATLTAGRRNIRTLSKPSWSTSGQRKTWPASPPRAGPTPTSTSWSTESRDPCYKTFYIRYRAVIFHFLISNKQTG